VAPHSSPTEDGGLDGGQKGEDGPQRPVFPRSVVRRRIENPSPSVDSPKFPNFCEEKFLQDFLHRHLGLLIATSGMCIPTQPTASCTGLSLIWLPRFASR
jgi:hypothetical protein